MLSGTLPGLVARGARQRASQMNDHPVALCAMDRTRLTGRLVSVSLMKTTVNVSVAGVENG